jgi:hypothetical protein
MLGEWNTRKRGQDNEWDALNKESTRDGIYERVHTGDSSNTAV